MYDWINVLIRKGFKYIYGIFYVWYFLYKKILKFSYTFYTEPINPLCINGFNGIKSFYTEKPFFHCMMKILANSLYHNDTMYRFFGILR